MPYRRRGRGVLLALGTAAAAGAACASPAPAQTAPPTPIPVRVQGVPSRDNGFAPLFREPNAFRTGEEPTLPPVGPKCGPNSINKPTPEQAERVKAMIEGALIDRADDPDPLQKQMPHKGVAWVCDLKGEATVLISTQGVPVVSGDESRVTAELTSVQDENGHTKLQERIVAAAGVYDDEGRIAGVRAWGGDGGQFNYDVEGFNVALHTENILAVVIAVDGSGAVLIHNSTGSLSHEPLARIEPTRQQDLVPLAQRDNPDFFEGSVTLLNRLLEMANTMERDPAARVSDFFTVEL